MPSRRCGEPHSRLRSGSPSSPSSRPGAPTPQSTSTPAAASRRGPTPSSSTAGARGSTRLTPHRTPPHPSSGTRACHRIRPVLTPSARLAFPRAAAPLGFCGSRTHRGGAGGQDQMRLLNAAHFVDLGRASSRAIVCATSSVRGFGWDGRNFCRQVAFLVVAS